MRRHLVATIVVATALPAVVSARVAAAANRENIATRLRRWADGVSFVALLVTAPLWLIVVLRGALYPVFGGGDLENSWGGPTLVGAWAVHLMIGIVALLAVSFVLAWWRSPDAGLRHHQSGDGTRPDMY